MLTKTSLDKVRTALQQAIREQMEQNDISGMAISLVGSEGILWTEGFGHTDRGNSVRATPDSLFNLQSSGKMVNATTFLRIMQKGMVDLETPLIDVYPEFHVNDRWDGQQYRKITFRHLLSHHAGLTHESPLGGNWDNRDLPFEEIIASINGTWMVAPVGQEHRYSNCGMSLVLYGLQRVTGLPARELVRQELIEPLGISSMTYGKPAALQHPEYVTGYDGGTETLFESFSDLGAGCQYCSVRDFSRFVQMRLNDGKVNGETYLEPGLLQEARTPQFAREYKNNSAGLGLFIFPNIIPGELVYGHAGGGCGYSGEILWSLTHGIAVIVETNDESNGFPAALALARQALTLAVEAQGIQIPTAPRVTITDQPAQELDSKTRSRLEGEYVYYDTRVKVSQREGKLAYELYGDEHTLTHHGDLVFTADYPPGIKFFLNEAGAPSHLMWLNGQGEFLRFAYDHISHSDPDSDPEELEKHVGLYQGKVYGFRPYGAVRRSGRYLEVQFFRFYGKVEEHLPGLFFTPDGEPIRFDGNSAWFGNRLVEKVNDPIGDLNILLEKDPENYMLSSYNLKHSLIPMLEFLGREEEVKQALTLYNQLYPESSNPVNEN